MPRYVALLRGVSPMNLRMPDLKRTLEAAGFANVKTLLSSGNVAFDARKTSHVTLEKKIEKALESELGKNFLTIIRAQDELNALLEADAFAKFKVKPVEKKLVTFLKDAPTVRLKLPMEEEGARILAQHGREVYMTYVPNHPKGAVFMRLLEKTLGKGQTTRTWDTVRKCAIA
jgi:uncharacterized protein (DUF1697 family)